VFKARHKESGKIMAVKQMRILSDLDEASAGRELDVLAPFNESGPVFCHLLEPPIHDREGHSLYLVFEDLEYDLSGLGLKQPQPITASVLYLHYILTALAAMHSDRLIHCDVEPANILIRPDHRVSLTDFGLAK
jgi:serine/threonine-protein kinase